MNTIKLDNISKKFKIGYVKKQNPVEKFISVFSGKEPQKIFWALKNISFQIKAGESVGIIGKNGAGKSTLLRIIAGIYQQNGGAINVQGKVLSVIASSIDFHERLTMRDNIFLIGALLGLEKQMIKNRFESIVEFSELKDFVDTKLYQFSDGMKVKLLTSLYKPSNADILILDDVDVSLDINFINKFYQQIVSGYIKKRGGIYLIASHNVNVIKDCDRIIWLDEGEMVKIGKPDEIITEYLHSLQGN